MKKSLLTLLIALSSLNIIVLSGCGSSTKTEQDNHEAMNHTCPMHPEVRGKAGETCPHCGMALEKIEQSESDHTAHP